MRTENELKQIKEKINEIENKSGDGGYIYRGEPECYKRVSSNLWRELEAINAKYSDIKEIEAGIVAEAKLYTDKTDDSEIRDDIQHYGGKTNSIDFTTDYNVALFFACYGSPNKSGRVIILRETEKIKEMSRCPKTPKDRVDAQKSILVDPPKGYIEEKFEVICIPKELKLLILQHLKETVKPEISPKTIYNDIHGFITSHNDNWMAYRDFYNGLASQDKANKAKTLKEQRKAYKEAIDHYTNALNQNLQLFQIYNHRGNAYNKIDEQNLAIEDYTNAILLKPDYIISYFSRGYTYGDRGDYHESTADYTKVITLKPDDAKAYNNRGVVHGKKGEYDNAISDFTKAIAFKPDYAEAYNNRGNTYIKKDDCELAIKDCNKAITLKADYAEAYYNRGTAYGKKNEHDLAIQDFNRAIALKPDDAEVYNNRAVAYYNKGEFDLAIENYNIAIKLKPDYTEALDNRRVAYSAKRMVYYERNSSQFGLDYGEAVRQNPDDPNAYYNRGVAFLRLKLWDKARSDLISAKDMDADIVASFHNFYANITDFEHEIGVKLPEDITAMLTRS